MTIESYVHQVAACPGPPTIEELRLHYPARFTWLQLKTFINSRDLGLLRRDKELQCRYDRWAIEIRKKYGTELNYLTNYRLQWGKPDPFSLLGSSLVDQFLVASETLGKPENYPTPEYFKADIPVNSDLICIIRNDWPYSVPLEIEHSLVWTRVPIFHPALIPSAIDARVQQDGLYGFTGSKDTIESLPSLESCLPALADWGVTMDSLAYTSNPNDLETMLQTAGKEVHEFVRRRWNEHQWETAWFVNPPRLQSIKDLAHIHVFARRKKAEEEASWRS